MSAPRTRSLGIKQGFPAYAGPVLSHKTRRRLLEEEHIDYSRSGKYYVVYTDLTAADFERIMAKYVFIDAGKADFPTKTPTMPVGPVDVDDVIAEMTVDKTKTITDLINEQLDKKKAQAAPSLAYAMPDPRKETRFVNQCDLYVPKAREAILKFAQKIGSGLLPKNMQWVRPAHVAWAMGQEMFDGGTTAEQFADAQFRQWGTDWEEIREDILRLCR